METFGIARSLFFALAWTLVAGAANALTAQELTAAQWREDLEFLTSAIRSRHPEPFHAVRQAEFDRRVERLYESIPNLQDHEVMVEMAGVAAMLVDGHTAIRGGLRFLSGQYPLRLEVFDDGIFIVSAPENLRSAIGARLVRIGDVTAEEAYQRVASVTAHDNENTLKSRVPGRMTIPEILHALAIIPERTRARFVVVSKDGRQSALDLNPVAYDRPIDWIQGRESGAQPLYLQHPNRNYWHEHLAGSQTLYVQYNRVENAEGEPIDAYFASLTRLVEETPLARIVLDVRLNGGGNDYLNAPVVDWVKVSLPRVAGRFYVIIGRGTYSAAQKLVTRLDLATAVVFVGEPTGGSPNHFGDAVTRTLPNSGLTLTVSSRYHNDEPGGNHRTFIPDILAPLTSVDYFAGTDPALDTILSLRR
jgi:hypothetical protein